MRHARDVQHAERLLRELFDASLIELRRRLHDRRRAELDRRDAFDLMQHERDRNRDGMRRDEHRLGVVDIFEIDPGDGELAVFGSRRLREIDGEKVDVVAALQPLAILLGGTAEENEIEIFELVVGDGGDDCGLVADVGERAGFADRVEQHEPLMRERALAEDRFDLVADERERIDDAETVPGGMLGIRHAARVLPRLFPSPAVREKVERSAG